MKKQVDITNKLNFDEAPCLVVKGRELRVNTDAPTMLKLIGIMSDDNPGAKEIIEAYEMIFPKNSRDIIEKKLRLSFNDLIVVVREAINLILGEEENIQGE